MKPQDAVPGSPPFQEVPVVEGDPRGSGGPYLERPKGSVKLFVGQIGREMDAAGY